MKRNALLFNMPLEEFWYGNPQNFYAYADAYELKNQNKDYFCWLQSSYNLFAHRQALSECLSKSRMEIFPKKCFSEQEQEKDYTGIAKNKLQEKILQGLLNATPCYKK